MCRWGRFLRIVALTALTVLPGTQERSHAAILLTVSTKVKVTQIQASRDREKGIDPKTSKGMLRAIRKEFKDEYESFTRIGREVQETRLGKDVTFTLRDGRKVIIRIVGYVPKRKDVDLKIQTEADIVVTTVKSGKHWCALVEKKKDPVILVVTPTLLQIYKD